MDSRYNGSIWGDAIDIGRTRKILEIQINNLA